MSHSNNTGNGCSLEDCHTNLFALTDLAGIKWRKLKTETQHCLDPLDDPVFLSFTRCIQSDVLCVWQRVKPSGSEPRGSADTLYCNKELWIFWYGDPPVNMSSLIAPELQEVESGSWDIGLSYECRTLLFKALHNLIERCLLSHNFVRLGKWFVQPFDHLPRSSTYDKSAHLSIQFGFFLHGESTVCTGIDVRQHPPLWRLQPYHLTVASQQGAQQGLPVILSPYGLAGTLTGHIYKESEPTTQKILEEWKHFFVVPDPETWEGGDHSAVPRVVEVVVAGVRMRYPSSYVLITGETEAEIIRQNGGSVPLSPPVLGVSSPGGGGSGGGGGTGGGGGVQVNRPVSPITARSTVATALTGSADHDYNPVIELEGADRLSDRLLTKVMQDSSITSGVHLSSRHQPSEGTGDLDPSLGQWEYGEPLQRNSCACNKPKHPKQRAGSGIGSLNTSGRISPPTVAKQHGKSTAGDKSEKSDKERRRNVAFHRKNMLTEAFVAREMDFMMQGLPARAVGSYKGNTISQNSQAGNGGNISGVGGGSSNNVSGGSTVGAGVANSNSNARTLNGSTFDDGPDSPKSAAPSPLTSQTQPSLTPNIDQSMPTLSPQPITKEEKDLNSSTGSGTTGGTTKPGGTDGGITGSLAMNGHLTTPTPGGTQLGPTANGPNGGQPVSQMNSSIGGGGSSNSVMPVKQEPGGNISQQGHIGLKEKSNSWLESQHQKRSELKAPKRPILPKQGYETQNLEEMSVQSLYNFDTLNAWLNYPVKKKRLDLDRKALLSPTGNNNLSNVKVSGQTNGNSGLDVYEFTDEAPANTLHKPLRSRDPWSGETKVNGFGEESQPSFQDDNKSSMDSFIGGASDGASSTGRLMLSENDLKPKYDDLEKMFDTSDSDPDDGDPFSVPSPPKSIEDKHSGLISLGGSGSGGGSGPSLPKGPLNGPTPGELAIMFPTPPSLEPPHLSPGQLGDGQTDMGSDRCFSSQLDHQQHQLVTSRLAAHKEEKLNISDYSYVYKVPPATQFVSSVEYSPVELPSNKQEPLKLPPTTTTEYRPSWQYPMSVEKQPQTPTPSSLSTFTRQPPDRMVSMDTSPSTTVGGPRSAQQHTPRTPLSYVDLQSPASNASSYMHNLKSIDNHPTNSSMPEVNSVVVNIMLSDSLLNLFKDQNFDSCTICVCNMNIRGADVGLYLPDKSGESQYRCTCGFSAVVNRKSGANSGLFYEDEVEITGIRDERLEQKKPSLLSLLSSSTSSSSSSKDSSANSNKNNKGDSANPSAALSGGEPVSQELLLLIQGQFSTVYPSYTVSKHCSQSHNAMLPAPLEQLNFLEMQDGCEACYTALEVGRQCMDNCPGLKLDDQRLKATSIHKWPFLQRVAKLPGNSQDTMRLLRSLLPLLEDAIQKKRTSRVWESVYRITGPLSWKDFHLLAGRGSDEVSEPQPVPAMMVGCDKELLSLSPYALQFWDKFLLEPFGRQRDVAYMVVAPDSDFVLSHAKPFFMDLCREYELCRLGRHRPIAKEIRDGILRVGKKTAQKLANEQMDDWFKNLGESPVAAKMRLYAMACRHQLAPYLSQQGTLDKKDIFEEINHRASQSSLSPGPGGTSSSGSSQNTSSNSSHSNSSQQQSSSSSSSQPRPSPAPGQTPSPAPPRTPDDSEGRDNDEKEEGSPAHQKDSGQDNPDQEGDSSELPSVVIYLIDPFTHGSSGNEWAELPRLSMLGLLRCYLEALKHLPEHLQNQIHLQIIPLESLLEYRETGRSEPLRSLAMSVHAQCRRVLSHNVIGRTLTGFGPAATAHDKVQKSEPGQLNSIHLYSPPVVIAPTRGAMLSLDIRKREQANVLFCGYCLTEDQRWLLGVCTDAKGELLETCTINIEIPNRNRRKKASARKIGLQKLWDFVLGVLTMTRSPWRLVIGRFGRIGHSELKGWAGLLSRKNLARTSKQLKEMCNTCSLASSGGLPCIQSACLVSLELNSNLHIMPDTLKIEERQSSRSPLTTPRDASVTHILVIPTSATASASQSATTDDGRQEDSNNMDPDDLTSGFDGIGGDLGDIGGDLDIGDLNDIFGVDIMIDNNHMTDVDPKPHGTTSPTNVGPGGRLEADMGGPRGGATGSVSDAQEESANLLQQPLAIGFYVSTAKTGPLPKWFWSACPQREHLCPTCFKAALHVNCPNVEQGHDDMMHRPQQQQQKNGHPLDSNVTCDVLRYVLETYNSLSWLTLDPSSSDRRSCLPVHFVVLMQLYHAINRFL